MARRPTAQGGVVRSGDVDAAHVARFAPILAKALAHPLRVEIISQLGKKGRLSPSAVAEMNGGDLTLVSYHFRRLHSVGVLRAVAESQRGSAIQHHYVLSSPLGLRVFRLVESIAANRL